jgi:serine/threonine-protein kinase
MVIDRRNEKDFVKVLDFGIAKLQESSPGGAGSFQTVAGVVCGTPEYMSPEQARGEKLDARADLYSLGIMLYQLLTNRLPFEADSALGVVTKHLSEQPKPPSTHNPAIPASLEALCMALIRKKREERPATCMDVVAELERVEREIEAGMAHSAAAESDRTLVEVRPVQLMELEQARAEYQARMAAQKAQALLSPQQQAMQTTATAHGQAAVGYVAPPPAAAGGGAKMWIITVVVAVVAAVLAFVAFKVLSGDSAPAEPAPLEQPASASELSTPPAGPTLGAPG